MFPRVFAFLIEWFYFTCITKAVCRKIRSSRCSHSDTLGTDPKYQALWHKRVLNGPTKCLCFTCPHHGNTRKKVVDGPKSRPLVESRGCDKNMHTGEFTWKGFHPFQTFFYRLPLFYIVNVL